MDEIAKTRTHRKAQPGYRWENVEVRPYKEDERALFRAVTRQILFSDPDMQGELRYFDIAPGGFSTLERHEHMHAVVILRGRGQCLIGHAVKDVAAHDLVTVPPWTWHQFRAAADAPLGFLCLVNTARHKPQLPTEEDLTELKRQPQVAAFLGSVSE